MKPMAQRTDPPQSWWQTGYMRAVYDFEWLAKPEVEGRFFRNEASLTDYAKQLRTLEKQFQVFLILSFLGAFLVLAGGLPGNSKVEIFGVVVPASLITLQLIAVFVSGCFIQCMRGLASYMVLNGMLGKLLEFMPFGSEFVVARYDASHLWMNLLKRRTIGYQSPLLHALANGTFSIAGLLYLSLHFSIVGAALWKALDAAWTSGIASFAFFLAAAASLNFVAAVALFLLGFFVPLPYRASEAMKNEAESAQSGLMADENVSADASG